MGHTGVGLEGRFRAWHTHPEFGLLWEADLPNGTTTEGATHLMECAFRAGPQAVEWYLGLVSDAGFTGVDTDDTHGSHAGWSEFTGAITKRPVWVPDAAQGGRMDTAGVLQIPVALASGTVRGVFLANRKGVGSLDPAGTLYSTAVASAGLAVVFGGTIYVTYTLRAKPVS